MSDIFAIPRAGPEETVPSLKRLLQDAAGILDEYEGLPKDDMRATAALSGIRSHMEAAGRLLTCLMNSRVSCVTRNEVMDDGSLRTSNLINGEWIPHDSACEYTAEDRAAFKEQSHKEAKWAVL